jgi:hypothetical protein
VAIQLANRFALIAFATASLRGVIAGSDFQGTLKVALITLAVFYGIGLILGDLGRRVVEENVYTEIERQIAERTADGGQPAHTAS